MHTTLDAIDLQTLSSIYDERDTYLSIFLDCRHGIDHKYLDRREKQIRSALGKDRELRAVFDRNFQQASDLLEESYDPRTKGIAVFVSAPNDFSALYHLPLPLENSMILDTSPYIRPLAKLRDEYETYGLILIDTGHAKLYIVSSGEVIDTASVAADIMNKHKKGGFSQMRFQRLRRGAIDAFFKKVAERVEEILASETIKQLVLAGPGNAKGQFEEYLSPEMQSLIVDRLDVDLSVNLSQLITTTTERVAQAEAEASAAAVEELAAQILKNGLGVYGLKETIAAVQAGQAELLLVDKDLTTAGWICEHCQVVEAGAQPAACPYCTGVTSQVDVIEELIEFAQRNATTLEFVDDNDTLKDLGGVGALLRYRA